MSVPKKFYQKVTFPGIVGQSGWSGITDILSGDAIIVVSASQVKSGAAIHTGLGLTTVTSHRPLITSVDSIVNNTSFIIVVNNAVVDSQQVVFTIIEN